LDRQYPEYPQFDSFEPEDNPSEKTESESLEGKDDDQEFFKITQTLVDELQKHTTVSPDYPEANKFKFPLVEGSDNLASVKGVDLDLTMKLRESHRKVTTHLDRFTGEESREISPE
jgi:hypothetical protein